MSGTCPVCSAEQSLSLLCSRCCDRLERDLGDVASIVADLDVALSKMSRIGNAGPGGLARERTPINVGAMNAADDLQNTLTTWARDVVSEHLSTPAPPGPSVHAAFALLRHIDAIRRHPAVVELVDEVTDAIHQARRAVDRPADRIYLGVCMVPTPDEEGRDVTCLEEVWAKPGASETVCKVCGVTHEVRDRRAWLLKKSEDYLFGVKEASEMMGEVGGITVTQASIRGYIKRGKIAYHTGTMIRLGDLLEVIVGEGERKAS